MSEQVMVIVSDLDDAKHGEINVVESLPKAARLVETMLEAGFDQARIRVYTGAEMDMKVRQRPVVALVAGDEIDEPSPHGDDGAGKRTETSGTKPESRGEEVTAEPYEKNGVRFSTAFKSA